MGGHSHLPYDVEEFAERHGLSPKVADIVLRANRQSKEMADRGAMMLKQTTAHRHDQALPKQRQTHE